MSALEAALNSAIKEVEPFLEAMPTNTETTIAFYATEKALEVLEKVKPLLNNGNSDCLNFIDDLRAVQGSEKLIEQMEELNFRPAALAALDELKQKLEEEK
jgi:hypothetical protein